MTRKLVPFFSFVFIVTLILTSGCTPKYVVKVDSIKSEAAPEGKNYVLLPGSLDLQKNDLHFQEYSAYVVKVLAKKGYRQVERKEDCHLLIYLSYGVGEPQATIYSDLASYLSGSYAQNSPSAFNTPPAPVITPPVPRRPMPSLYPDYYDYRYVPYPYIRLYTVYRRFMVLEAVNYQASLRRGEAVPVWKVTVSSWGENYDLREVFPVLAAASEEYIGTDTGKEVEVVLSEDDVRVRQLK